ncbi:MAG TPA: formate dehydrogenase accessory sulfurtransferase FdhD [Spirochaetota bacterium]|nr:formate dehydrogenase accessory sulfurtransferase FdhD [Spirochaetota bacterium]HPQ52610.1 formate dehydrogenase accessory sulfurtransferase FdhD [Spirochaetota bacterium]
MTTKQLPVLVYTGDVFRESSQDVAVEAPLNCMINGRLLCRCMRLPGMDVELCLGLCYTMGLVQGNNDVVSVDRPCANTVVIETREEIKNFPETVSVVYSSGGFLKKNDYFSVINRSIPQSEESDVISDDNLFFLQKDFFSRQIAFQNTGATHGAALYDREYNFLAFAEDIGRHNALDKCIGSLLMEKTLDNAYFCLITSRLSYGILEKVVKTPVKVVAGVSAPTNIAVTLAGDNDITLVGFFRASRFTVYTGDRRIRRTCTM